MADNTAPGWIRHLACARATSATSTTADNRVCYQHLFTRVISWLPPYRVGVEWLKFEQHQVPALFSAALTQDGHGAKRRRLSQSIANPSREESPAPHASESVGNWMPASLEWMGMELGAKTPVNILNELGPKVFRCYPEFVTTTQEDAVNPYLTTVVMEGIVVARGGFTNKKASNRNRSGRGPRPPPLLRPAPPAGIRSTRPPAECADVSPVGGAQSTQRPLPVAPACAGRRGGWCELAE